MGTWAIPKENWEKDFANAAVENLKSFKNMIYSIVGDDELFTHLDAAAMRIKELCRDKGKGD